MSKGCARTGNNAHFLGHESVRVFMEGSGRTRQVETLISWQRQHGVELVTSTLTIGELLVHPLREDRKDLADRYLASFSQLHVILCLE